MPNRVDTGDAHLDAIEHELAAAEPTFTLLKASPHQRGPGKTHILIDGKTRCGKTRDNCPGRLELGPYEYVTCGGCRQSHESAARRAEKERQWQLRQAERDRQWEREREERKRNYNAYLQTPEWRHRRDRVMLRAGTICEGCGERGAAEVHHLTYERVGSEMLFDLVAVCVDCHRRIHDKREAA